MATRLFPVELATCLVATGIAVLAVPLSVLLYIDTFTPDLVRALAVNGVPIVSIKPYTTALVAVLVFCPMVEAVVYVLFVLSPREPERETQGIPFALCALGASVAVCRSAGRPRRVFWPVRSAPVDPKAHR